MANVRAVVEWLRPVLEPMPRRKQLLLACAYVRRFREYWPGDLCTQLVETSERFADGKAGSKEVRAVWKRCTAEWKNQDHRTLNAMYIACELGFGAATSPRGTPWKMFDEIFLWVNLIHIEDPSVDRVLFIEREFQAVFALARELGSDVTDDFDPKWRTSDTRALARRIYGTQNYHLMPILADALQDAGCESADVLQHCRGDGPHARGCWVVDAVLGR